MKHQGKNRGGSQNMSKLNEYQNRLGVKGTKKSKFYMNYEKPVYIPSQKKKVPTSNAS